MNIHYQHQLKDIILFIKKKKFRRIFIITGNKSFLNCKFNQNVIKKINSKFFIYFKDKTNFPVLNELLLICDKVKNFNPDLIIALGGGTVLDYAKLANIFCLNNRSISNIRKNKIRIKNKFCKLLALPTTAGSGAEVTKFSVIYVNNIKYSIEHKLLKPDYFFLIPEFAITSSAQVRMSSGFDAIAQAIESLFSRNSNKISLKYSLISLKYSLDNFVNFVRKPNLKNSLAMLNASNFSGQSINIAKTNAPHALSYYYSSKFKLLHGVSVSIFFKEFINYFYFNRSKSVTKFNLNKRFKIFFKSIKIKNILDFNKKLKLLLKNSGLIHYVKKYQRISKINRNANVISNSVNKERLNNSPLKLNNIELTKIILGKSNF